MSAATTAVVLAAGAGARMRSRLPKVLHPLAGRPMLLHVLDAIAAAGVGEAVVVTGHGEAQVRAAVDQSPVPGLSVTFVRQAEQRGTGHALLQARAAVTTPTLLAVNGDLGLLTAGQLRPLLDAPPARVVLATATVPDPDGLGRIVRDAAGALSAIVEQADADAATAAIGEVNLGLYRFEAAWLWATLETLAPSAGGEIYLTDAVAQAVTSAEPGGAAAASVEAPDGPLNIESRAGLARAEAALRARIAQRWLAGGVTIIDPATTYIDAAVCLRPDTVLEPGTHLRGRTDIGADCLIGPNAVIRDSRIGDRCRLSGCTITGATLADGVAVGPYSTIREGSRLDRDVAIGTHAEIKNAHLGPGVKMGHFAYLGDADVGAGANIGAGAITCNYDGAAKHRTVIGERVFIGSDSLLIAPLTIGDDAVTGAGSIVTRDVAPGQRVVGAPARRSGRRGAARP